MQSGDSQSVFHISGKSPTPSCGCVKGLAFMDGAERDVIPHVYDHRHMEFPVRGNHKDPQSHHVSSRVNVSAWRICSCFILFAWLQRCLSDAFLISCRQQISVNVIHYSVITNCGLHKSAHYLVKVQRNVSSFRSNERMQGQERGEPEDTLERSHLSADLGKFWGSPQELRERWGLPAEAVTSPWRHFLKTLLH